MFCKGIYSLSKGLTKEMAEKAGGYNSKHPLQLGQTTRSLAMSEMEDSPLHVFTSLLSQGS